MTSITHQASRSHHLHLSLSKCGLMLCLLASQLLTACAYMPWSEDEGISLLNAAHGRPGNKIIADSAHQEFVRQIAQNWQVPANSVDKRTYVRVTLKNNGQINDIIITHSSGNQAYDRSVVNAIRTTAPFALPDDTKARKRACHFTAVFTS